MKQSLEFVKTMQKKYSAPHFYLPLRCILDRLEKYIDSTTYEFAINQAFQSAEAACNNGKSDWFCLTLFIYNLAKIMYLYEEEWDILAQSFIIPPEAINKKTETYAKNCGLRNTIISYSCYEYLYQVLNYNVNNHLLPPESLYLIRYGKLKLHSEHNVYDHLLDDYDKGMQPLLDEFNAYNNMKMDVDVEKLRIKYYTLWKMFFQNFGLYL